MASVSGGWRDTVERWVDGWVGGWMDAALLCLGWGGLGGEGGCGIREGKRGGWVNAGRVLTNSQLSIHPTNH